MPTVSFRISDEKKIKLDELASCQDRDRTYIINEAIDTYLDVMAWQFSSIQKGLEQADHGEFAAEVKVKAAFDKWKA